MNHLKNKTWVMTDLETMSTKPNAAILSIGAIEFTINKGITKEFTINIDPKSSKSFGLHFEKETIQWWMTQSKEARDAWSTNPQPLDEACKAYIDWLGNAKDTMMIVNGLSFDIPILVSSFQATGLTAPWKYWNEIDQRTISTLFNIRMSKGNEHTALGDCRNQVKQFLALFKEDNETF